MNPLNLRIRHLAMALAAFGLLLGTMYLAAWGAWNGQSPADLTAAQIATQVTGKLVGTFYLFFGALPVLASFWLGAAGLGWPIRRYMVPATNHPVIVQLGVGLALMLLMAWSLGLAGWLNAWSAWGLCTLGMGVLLWRVGRQRQQYLLEIDRWPIPPWTLLVLLPVLGLWLVAASCPPGTLWNVEARGYDALSYHLQLPRVWLTEGRITGLAYCVYSYLPNLAEAGYMQLGAMAGETSGGTSGGMSHAVYTTQFFHASAGLLAALALGSLVSQRVGPTMGLLAAAVFLAVPWNVIAGTLPYTEMLSLAPATVSLLLVMDADVSRRRRWFLAGLLLGVATLAKLTIGAMLLPGMLLWGLLAWDVPSDAVAAAPKPARLAPPLLLLAGLLLVLSPYLARNAIWTGNPVFPLAMETLGRGHFSPEQVQRWQAAHQASAGWGQRLDLLVSRWLLNQGFGALGPSAPPVAGSDAYDITRLGRTGWLPVLMLLAAGGAYATLRERSARRLSLGLLALLIGILIVWLAATHLQSRFLIPTALPLAILTGLGLGRLRQACLVQHRWLPPTLAGVVMLLLTLNSVDVLTSQTPPSISASARPRPAALWQVIDSLPTQRDVPLLLQVGALPGDHVLNTLPPNSRTLLVADASVFYINRPILWHSVFDTDPLGELMRATDRDPVAVTSRLRARGITHVWVNLAELARLRATYGYDPDLTPATVQRLAQQAGWRVLLTYPWAVLFALP